MKPRSFLYLLLSCLFALIAFGQQNSSSAPQSTLYVEPPYSPSLDLSSMDRGVDPCVDFYTYSCGGWQKKNPIPPDQTSWSVYGKLYQDNLNYLRSILEKAAAAQDRDLVTQKIGDYYSACMNEGAVEKLSAQPMQPELERVATLNNVRDMGRLVAQLQDAGVSVLFESGSTQDPDDSDSMIAGLFQAGLGMPDRDYYLKDDAKSKETRARYLEYVQQMFTLLGDSPDVAKKNAATVMKIETSLAKASLSRVDLRDPYKIKNKMSIAQLNKIAPDFDWAAFFATTPVPLFQTLNISSTQFFQDISNQAKSASLDDWKAYLRFHVADSRAPYLSSPFVNAHFEFHRKYLHGAKELQPRWKRCVQYVDHQLGEALGQEYVRNTFPPDMKAGTLEMTRQIEDAMAVRIQQLDWMSPETKQQALVKLKAIRNKIGYPDKWRDYSTLVVEPGEFYGNVVRANEYESKRDWNKVSKPVDRGEWDMTPPTVNAYYNPQMNDINFPAGVLQPPLYDAKMDDAPNYGDTGSTIGHELTHGFDDEGRQFDAKGNLKDWWTKQDAEQFIKHSDCVVDQYAKYIIIDDIHINSKLTEGEDVADLGGTILAYVAWKNADKSKELKDIDGLTPDQRFFIGMAQWACSNDRPEDERARAITDPHSPPKYRVNGVVVNMPEFGTAFSCKTGQPMVKPAGKVCKVW